MRSNDGNSNTEDIPDDNSADLLRNLKDNIYSLVCKKESNKHKNGFNLSLMGQKERSNDRFSSTNYSEIRCQSLPDCVEKIDILTCSDGMEGDKNNCDDTLQTSPVSDSWFKTWPERCDKQRSTEASPNHSPITTPTKNQNTHSKFNCDNLEKNTKNKVTLNEALKNISLAYSPVTKQLHLIEQPEVANKDTDYLDCTVEQLKSAQDNSNERTNSNDCFKKLGHRRTEAGSFSSTISTISEPSSNGSLLSTDDRSLSSFEIPSSKTRKKSLTHFFSK